MAIMSEEDGFAGPTLVAASDYSAKQFYIMKRSATTATLIATEGDSDADAVLMNDPESGEAAELRVFGEVTVKCGGTIAYGEPFTSSSAGKAIKATAAYHKVLGFMLEAASDGQVARAFLLPELATATTPGDRWIKFAMIAGTTAVVDTTIDLPAKAIVEDAYVYVTTAETTGSTKTIDVGLLASESGGDEDGFIDGISVAATGLKKPVFVATVGSNNTYLGAASTHTRGVLLTELLIAGEDTAAGGDGFAQKGQHIGDSVTAKSITYTRGSTLTEFVGFGLIRYRVAA